MKPWPRRFKAVIAHDGIDELLGGYWNHRKLQEAKLKHEYFNYFWKRLIKAIFFSA